jgi:hypothetical protein
MIGETMVKCKYIDPKKIAKLQTEMCLVLLVTAYNQNEYQVEFSFIDSISVPTLTFLALQCSPYPPEYTLPWVS